MSGKKQAAKQVKGKGKPDQGKKQPELSKREKIELDIEQKNQIIEKVKDYPQIYQKSHPLFKRNDLKQNLFDEFAPDISPHPYKGPLTGEEVASRWKSLVDCYRKRLEASGSGGKSIKQKSESWTFYREMSFMKQHVGYRK